MQKPKNISVIITTYNAPEPLDKVLLGYSLQSDKKFEILIADDGSSCETAQLIRDWQQATSIPIYHVWHEDNGFRKCEILNRAIEAANGDYLIFTDGDCIPRNDFVAVHRHEAEPEKFLSGTYNTIPETFGKLLDDRVIESGEAFELAWLRRNGMPRSRKSLRLMRKPKILAALNALTTTRPTWNGCNASGWKSDIVAVNGFDTRMRYGGLDRELGLRLVNHGIQGKQIRFKAICLHVDHPRGYANETDIQRNLEIRAATIRNHSTFATHGIRRAA